MALLGLRPDWEVRNHPMWNQPDHDGPARQPSWSPGLRLYGRLIERTRWDATDFEGLTRRGLRPQPMRDSRFPFRDSRMSSIGNLECWVLSRESPGEGDAGEMTRTAAGRGHASPPISNPEEFSPSPAGPSTENPAAHTTWLTPRGPVRRIANPATFRRGVPRLARRPLHRGSHRPT